MSGSGVIEVKNWLKVKSHRLYVGNDYAKTVQTTFIMHLDDLLHII